MTDPHSVAHATNAAAHWAVVIDAGPDATRINQASADSCLTRPALPYYDAEPDYRWADGVAAALGKIATKAALNTVAPSFIDVGNPLVIWSSTPKPTFAPKRNRASR